MQRNDAYAVSGLVEVSLLPAMLLLAAVLGASRAPGGARVAERVARLFQSDRRIHLRSIKPAASFSWQVRLRDELDSFMPGRRRDLQ